MEKSLHPQSFLLSAKWEKERKLQEEVESDEEFLCWSSYQCTTK